MQRADHDPILHVGYITCGGCKAESWPVEAQRWGTHILATFEIFHHERTCQARRQLGTLLIDPVNADPSVPKVQRPPRPDTNRCKATTRAGDRCLNGLKDGDFCGVHATRQRQEAS